MAPGPSRQFVVATRNDHKLRELREILLGVELLPLPPDVELPPEDAETFADNALVKARCARDATGIEAIADDSGIIATALGGRPGVRSARYAGPSASDEANLALLIRELEHAADRSVAYVCAIAYAGPGGEESARLAFSFASVAEIEQGIELLADLVRDAARVAA